MSGPTHHSVADDMVAHFGSNDASVLLRRQKSSSLLSEQSIANRLLFRHTYRFRPLPGRPGWIEGIDRNGQEFATPLDLAEIGEAPGIALLREGRRIGPATHEQVTVLEAVIGHPLHAVRRREDSDYLYAAEDLRTLHGAQFVKARQYGRQLRAAGTTATPFRPDDAADAHILIDAWQQRRPAGASDAAESRCAVDLAAARLIDGVAVRRDGALLGFLLFDATIEDMIVALILKTADRVQGLTDFCFQACAQARPDKRYLNTCQDLGIAGLRARKLAMLPVAILSKSYVSLVPDAPAGGGVAR